MSKLCLHHCERERERKREKEKAVEREKERKRETEKERKRERERERDRDRDRERRRKRKKNRTQISTHSNAIDLGHSGSKVVRTIPFSFFLSWVGNNQYHSHTCHFSDTDPCWPGPFPKG